MREDHRNVRVVEREYMVVQVRLDQRYEAPPSLLSHVEAFELEAQQQRRCVDYIEHGPGMPAAAHFAKRVGRMIRKCWLWLLVVDRHRSLDVALLDVEQSVVPEVVAGEHKAGLNPTDSLLILCDRNLRSSHRR